MPGIQYPLPHLPMLGKGSILFDRFDASGNPQGYSHFGNCTKFELQIKDERAELFQSLNKSASLIANALKKRTPTLAITGHDFRSDVMAIAMMSAGKTVLSVGAASITAEQIVGTAPTKKGKFFALAHRSVDPTPANVTVKQGVATLTADTDYQLVDPTEGLIYFPTGSGVDDTKAVTVDYATLSKTFDQVAGGTVPQVSGRIRFVPDPADGQKIGVEVWRVNLFPTGQVGLIADDYGNWTLDAAILDDTANHPTAPYFLETFYP
jgi:hypothetical protein